MRFKITSALVLHRFIKISLRRMFSRSVSGRPLRKPNNFCISPLASERLFKASISLSVKRCLGYLPSNRLRGALVDQGIVQGMKQGVEKEKMSLAQMMIEEKEPADKISKYTGYALDKLKEIASAMGQTLV